VSRPWSERVRVRLGAQAVHGSLSRAWPRRVLARAARTAPAGAPSQPGTLPDDALIDGLLAELAGPRSLRGARLAVEIANAQVQLDIVTGDYRQLGPRRLQAIASACASDLLGDDLPGHEIRWHLQPDRRHLLIAALPLAQAALADAVAARHGMALSSLQPAFCAQWQRHAPLLAKGSGVLAMAGDDQVLLALVAGGIVTALATGRWARGDVHPDTGPTALDMLCGRLLASQGLDLRAPRSYLLVTDGPAPGRVSPAWLHAEVEGVAP